jgi:3',5'-cyclic AMP phosphodiesterase CpdA
MPSYRPEPREDPPPRFVMLSDTQRTMPAEAWRRDPEAERRAVARAVAAEDPAFVVNAGDLTCHGSYPEEWRRFREEQDPIFSRGIPYYPALGNHDYYGDRAVALRRFFTFFPDLGGRRWYEVRFPPVLVVVLDSNFDQLTAAEAAEQDGWLEKTLAAAESDGALRHVILCFHHPPFTNAKLLSGSEDARRRFVSRLTPKVKVVFSGHVHSYERFVRDGVHFVVSGGAGGPPADVETDAPRLEPAYSGRRSFHYCRFTVAGERLVCDVVMLMDDGSWMPADGFACP